MVDVNSQDTGSAHGAGFPRAHEDQVASLGSRFDVGLACLLGVGTLVLLLATMDDFGMTWDEGFTVEREERLKEWFARVAGDNSPGVRAWSPPMSNLESRADYLRQAGPRAASPWSRDSLRFFWPFAREEPNGHPPFYALIGLSGWAVGHRFLAPLESYRCGPAILFALTIGAIYGFMARLYGRPAGLAAALVLLTMPRVFAHAHLASYDAPLLCLWFLAVAAFSRSVEPTGRGWAWVFAFGIAWGCAAATKFTGWFVPVPLVAWSILQRDRRGIVTLLVGGLVAALVFYALNPPWWFEPIRSLHVFLQSNLGREHRSPIPTQFFGQVYPFSLPWFNTLVWTAIVVPPITLALALIGITKVVAGRLSDRGGTLLLASWLFLMVLRALPGTPGHDGERQFLPAFVFLACLAGVGVAALASGLARGVPGRFARPLAAVSVACAVAAGAWTTWLHHPLQLSYYNALIGGLSGAARAGMEPTYYWDALTPDARDWINARTKVGQSLMVAYPIPTFDYLHHWGLLRPSPLPSRANPPQWYLVQNRPGILRSYPVCALAADLLGHARPVFVKALEIAPEVPLVAIFAIEDAVAVERERER